MCSDLKMEIIIIIAVAVIMNLICFFLMRYDKQCAKTGKRRIPEKMLFLSAGLFGAIGGVAAMKLLRHKTKHWYFQTFFPLMMVLQILILGFVIYKLLS